MVSNLIESWLSDMGIDPTRRDGSFMFATGSTAVVITPDDEGENAFVNIECPVLMEPRVGQHLMKELLKRNARLKLGAFALEDGCVTLSYTMPAAQGASGHFAEALRLLVKAADSADDELQAMFGGRRVADGRAAASKKA
ncbi:MAG: YbjN domain-containing protein [bacterium]|jgi:3-oxoacyl-[acyl-carrier-protein] synthase III